jgi:phage terminase large subunit-like protein
MTDRSTNSKFRPLSSDKKKSGLRVHCGLVDELQEHQDRYTVDILKDGFKARKQPLLFVITNSGFDRASICWEWHEHACAVVEGLREDDQLFAYVMALDDADDPLEDESCWPKTNPGLGRTITLQYLRQQVSEANQIPGRENQVRRLNFCQWTDADLGWMTRNAWKSIEEELVEFKKPKLGSLTGGGAAIAPGFQGAMCYLGLDLAYAFDLAALAFLFPEDGRLVGWIEYFTPAETAKAREKKDAVPYVQWIGQGLIHGVPGKVIRKEHISARIAEAVGSVRYPLRGVRSVSSQRARSGNGRARRRRSMDRAPARLPARGQLPHPQYAGPMGRRSTIRYGCRTRSRSSRRGSSKRRSEFSRRRSRVSKSRASSHVRTRRGREAASLTKLRQSGELTV